jgi:ribonuclease Z
MNSAVVSRPHFWRNRDKVYFVLECQLSARELFVLGTASQVPTRHRNHNGYFLRWDQAGILFDPGEGTQRQMILAGLSVSAITHICITHFHGDHCLGLAGILQRLSLDDAPPVSVHYPASGQVFYERLRDASIYLQRHQLRPCPISASGVIHADQHLLLEAVALDHAVDCFGYRVREPDAWRAQPERLEALGLHGPVVGELLRAGKVTWQGREVQREEVCELRTGQSFAFVMDTRWCAGAEQLARGADLLVCEATFAASEAALAQQSGHMTAQQAGRLARVAGVRQLVIGHFSQRYSDVEPLLAEARAEHGAVIAAVEPDPQQPESMRHRIAVPGRGL